MDEKKYKITLSDGTVLSDLTLNGNNYISPKEISEDVFNNNLSPVTIFDGEAEETHSSMELIHITKMDSEYWFALRDLNETELRYIKDRSDIEYIALMCDVEL